MRLEGVVGLRRLEAFGVKALYAAHDVQHVGHGVVRGGVASRALTVEALLAGLMIFPAAFSVGVQPDSGPSLIYITLPNVFQQAFSAVPFVGTICFIA